MSKRKSRKKSELAKKDREAQKQFFKWAIIVTVVLLAIMYFFFKKMVS